MIKFDITKIRYEYHRVKSCTTANGGSLTVLDDKKSTPEKEIFRRLPCGMDLVRSFQKLNKSSRYYIPILVAVAYYEDTVIAIERHTLGAAGTVYSDGLWGRKRWICNIEECVTKVVAKLVEQGDWFIDGKYLYTFCTDVDAAIKNGDVLSRDGKFRALPVQALQLSKMSRLAEKEREVSERCCLAFVASNGQYAITPPVWKDLSKLGGTQMRNAKTEDGDVLENGGKEPPKEYRFDTIDSKLCVNLSFVLDAAKTVGANFGYDEIDYLQLDEMMIRLHTVNLPNVSQAVKSTFDTGLKFKTTLAWLIGKLHSATTMEQHQEMRGTIKYLTTKGIFFKASFSPELLFQEGHSIHSIARVNVEEALEDSKGRYSVDRIINMIMNKRKGKMVASEEELVSIAGFQSEE